MGPRGVIAAVGGALLIVAACSGSASPSTSPSAAAPASVAASAAPSAAPSVASSPSTAPVTSSAPSEAALSITPIDPCAVFTSADVKTLTGVDYGTGTASVLASEQVCGYASGSGAAVNEVHFAFLDASSVDDATVAYQEAYTKEQTVQKGIVLTNLSGIGDEAVMLSLTSSVASAEGIYVRSGKRFFDITFIGIGPGTPPSASALQTAATTALGRLP